MEKIQINLTACANLKIKLYIGTSTAEEVSSDDLCTNIMSTLADLPITDTTTLRKLLRIHIDDHPPTEEEKEEEEVNFAVDRLRVESECSYQHKYLTPHSKKYKHILDTHSTNNVAQYLCVSPANKGVIGFNAKPDLLSGLLPMAMEIKSRYTTIKGGPNKEEDDGTDSPLATATSTMRNLSLDSDVVSCRLRLITLVECDLFQQSVERILEQAQFRAYLSKFVVLASTGHMSWCFYYTQSVEKSSFEKKLLIMRISNADVNTVWNGMSAAVRARGDSFYLTKHGRIIANTLQSLFPGVDIHSIRVNVASVSQSVVYYVTPPLAQSKKVFIGEKRYALKIVADVTSFQHEINSLKRVEEIWKNEFPSQNFYYITNSNELTPTWSIPRQYSWLVAREAAVSDSGDPQYGVIVMYPATRQRLTQFTDADGEIFGQLFRSLSVAHQAGVMHCDLSPRNCLLFPDNNWQVVDYGLSGVITNREVWFTNYSGRISVQKGSYQHRCCGRRAWDIIQEEGNDLDLVEIDWTVGDDIEMLQRTCRREQVILHNFPPASSM